MARLTRAESQQRNRARILAAARAEFVERGFAAVKIDEIAERAELTRGAVYSNFPGKRALYFAVLATEEPEVPPVRPARTVREALSAFALVSVSQASPLARDLMPQILAEESTRLVHAQLVRLNAILLGLALEKMEPAVPPPFRRVRLATMALTVLEGASQLYDVEPALVEPFDVIGACEALADLELSDAWVQQDPPPVMDVSWNPPDGMSDVTFVGVRRLWAVEEVLRRNGTAVLVMRDAAEIGPLVRLNMARIGTILSRTVGSLDMRIVCDDTGAIASSAGVPVGDLTDVRVRSVNSDQPARQPRARAVPRSG